ncbi:MAG: hypothetical protein Q8J64_09985 [Thermodesulfovibrionales bacterium]|nr:hypothetical protein [Thermodesulfovibrionales bacterium]
MKKSAILITCPKGLAPYLKDEVAGLGLPVIEESVSGVQTEGSLGDAMRLNLFLRTGHRVLLLLEDFRSEDAEGLYSGLVKINWEDYIPEDGYLCVTAHVENPSISDSRFANLRCKDAIVDRIRDKRGRRPDSGPLRDRTVVFLYWKGSRCSIYLDTSGEPLSKRGYRKIPGEAPMQETLAAALVMASGFEGSGNFLNPHFRNPHFINPMCGSGTLAIEAALLALKKAPGLLRSNFGFMHLKGFDRGLWEGLRTEAKKASEKTFKGRIIATDINPEAVSASKQNAKTAGIERLIEFAVCDYQDTPVPDAGEGENKGVIMLNPEYGMRMGRIKELEETYKGIGDFFKHKCMGYSGYIFTGNPELAKKVGLRAKRRIPFFNSNIECRLLEYELYLGSRSGK